MLEQSHTTTDDRQPVAFATYTADAYPGIVADIDSGKPMGPNYMGELMWPVSAELHETLERSFTRVGFSYVAPTGTQS